LSRFISRAHSCKENNEIANIKLQLMVTEKAKKLILELSHNILIFRHKTDGKYLFLGVAENRKNLLLG